MCSPFVQKHSSLHICWWFVFRAAIFDVAKNAGCWCSKSFSTWVQIYWNHEERACGFTERISKGSQWGIFELLQLIRWSSLIWLFHIKEESNFLVLCLQYLDQVHISEARVATALDKLAYMETLVNDRLLQERNPKESSPNPASLVASTSSVPVAVSTESLRKSLVISGPVKPYHPNLKNFWYPVAFSTDLKDDTMVSKQFLLHVKIKKFSM